MRELSAGIDLVNSSIRKEHEPLKRLLVDLILQAMLSEKTVARFDLEDAHTLGLTKEEVLVQLRQMLLYADKKETPVLAMACPVRLVRKRFIEFDIHELAEELLLCPCPAAEELEEYLKEV